MKFLFSPIGVFAVLCIVASMASTQTLNLVDVLPKADEVSGFKELSRNAKAGHLVSWMGRRLTDDLQLTVMIQVLEDEATASRIIKRVVNTPAGDMPSGTITGRKIGQQSWHSRNAKGGALHGSAKLIFLDGRSIVTVYLMYPLIKRENGSPVFPLVQKEDLRLAEDFALRRLERLRLMRLTATD